jgi:hypothetical protein
VPFIECMVLGAVLIVNAKALGRLLGDGLG